MVDNLITLYNEDETSFTTNGLGNLSEAVSCQVHEELNGIYELTMEYPTSGRHYSDIQHRRIIFAKPNPFDPPQAFRIHDISTPLQGNVTISAKHISYDLSGKPVQPFSSVNVKDAFEKIKSYSLAPHNFTFETDFSKNGSLSFNAPCSTRSLLGDGESGILSVFGGEYEWDNFRVILHESRGKNRGVSIRSGKNLLDLTSEGEDGEVPTGVYPYWYSDDRGLVTLHAIVYVNGADNRWVVPLDCSGMFQEYDGPPTPEMLQQKTEEWIKENCKDDPIKTSITFSFVPLSDSAEYKEFAALEEIHIGDIISLYAEGPEIDVERKCVSYNYDVLLGRYVDLTMGDPKESLAKSLVDQNMSMADTVRHLEVTFKIGIDSITAMVRDAETGLQSMVQQFSDHITAQVSSIDGRVTTVTQDLDSVKVTVQGQDDRLTSVEATAEGLTTTVSGVSDSVSKIEQRVNSIKLSVTGSLGDGEASIVLNGGGGGSGTIDLSEVRKAWADDPTNVTVTAGTITFNGNTVTFNNNSFIANSDNFKVDATGRITAWSAAITHILLEPDGTKFTFQEAPYAVAAIIDGNIYLMGDVNFPNSSYSLYGSTQGGSAGNLVLAFASHSRDYFGATKDCAVFGYSNNPTFIHGSEIKSNKSITTASDRRKKKDISPMTSDYLKIFDRMEPSFYRYIDEADDAPIHYGYIAQDVEQALYDAGKTRTDMAALLGDGDNEMMALGYTEFIPLMHLKLKQIDERLNRLEQGGIME